MSYIRLANFFQLYSVDQNGNKTVQRKFNNAVPGQSVIYDRLVYDYLSFVYQGAAKNRTGDNLEAQIILAVNQISTGLAKQAVDKKWMVQVYSAVMTDGNSVDRVLTTETWVAASMTYDNSAIEVVLSSAIDAVGANAPTRVLTRELVGDLPITGNIRAA